MGKLIIKEIDYNTAKEITIKNHYSKKWNTAFGKYNFGIFKENRLLGVAVYGNLMNPKSYKNWCDELEQGQVLELNRMWIDDELGHNAETILIGATFKLFKMIYPNIKIIQTFADGRLGCGTIYKASNFKYYGYTKSLFFENIDDGIVYHKVPMENSKRPKGLLKLNKLFLDNKLKPFFVKTYRYGYILDKRLRKKIKLKEKPYPTYDKGIELIEKYIHPFGLCVRVMLYFDVLNNVTYSNKMQDYIDNFHKNSKLGLEIKKQKENKSYLWFKNEYDKSDLCVVKEQQTTLFDFL